MTDRATIRSRREPDPTHRQAQSLGFLVGISIALLLALAWAGRAFRNQAQSGVPCTPEQINPNDAPLASLMRLPGIGLTRARAIVDYRNSPAGPTAQRPAFAVGDDMQQVKGFGPATVEDILPWLQFPASTEEYNRPSGAD